MGRRLSLARVVSYSTRTDRVTPIREHDPARFMTGAAGFLTEDESPPA
ncbi:MAG TPA: hypothetical protein VES02_03120 [Dermatophilaceae bacterium]|nr:hypothetical protein [Dermatophilaceae bacterium]